MIYVKKLDRLTENDLSQAGFKAVSLARVVKKGIFTPSGFVVMAAAFDRFCKDAKIDGPLNELLKGCDIKNLPDLSRRSSAIFDLIIKHPIQKEIVHQIDGAFDMLNTSYAAVRSSVAIEGGFSAASAAVPAGSFLTVAHPDLNERIKDCWASAFSAPALVYFLKLSVDPEKIRPAVLVQRMINSEIFGTAFSRLADRAGKERLVIEARQRFGGPTPPRKALPECYDLNIDPLYIIAKKAAGRCRMTGYQGNSFALRRSSAGRITQILTDDQIKWLAQAVIKIDGILGSPQDVEWSFASGRIAILRCRPIAAGGCFSNKECVWSNANISEILPGIVLPLVSGNMIYIIEPALLSVLPVERNERLLRDFEGRLYFNATAVAGSLAKVTKLKKFPIENFFGGRGGGGRLEISFSGKLGLMSYCAKVFFHSLAASHKFKARIGGADKMAKEFDRRVSASRDLPDLLVLESEISSYAGSVMAGASTLLYPLAYFYIFTYLCQKWLNDKTGEKANAFMASGSRQIEMLVSFEALWDLSRAIKNNRSLSHRFLKAATISKALAVLVESREISAAWMLYLEKYGHRCANEADFSRPRWKENPSFLINTLKLYLGASEDADPTSRIEKLAKRKEMLLWETKRLLPNWKFAIFNKILRSAESAQILREQFKSVLIGLLFPLRSVYLKIGLAFKEIGALREASDVFFLTRDEIDAVRRKALEADPKLAALVKRRKSEYKRSAAFTMPDVFKGKPNLLPVADLSPGSKKVEALQGLGVSSGMAQGVARVVEKIDDIWKVRPGEILVCDHLDPGWTPVFVVVKGVVSNTGGLLSHASIVAREYGLPVVSNIAAATGKIKDGQRILVDGNRGLVKVIE
ncbi:MAG TPA: PEP/pyruvate-binding domain-containing protein [Candidatus Paceibacterota bacterium]|nr:PEP/pyruvate-binding domain-containing protein [Candidatus Pacearchaeota archaeon]HRZ50472.1 PEP/pyruvate-binding domain-containing protein [Candidatus Paceibacterota bacterium]HSA36193.1 PEP/pyruvate-binding domain-containing protein [Candidatus Paceibacterota bacterium]